MPALHDAYGLPCASAVWRPSSEGQVLQVRIGSEILPDATEPAARLVPVCGTSTAKSTCAQMSRGSGLCSICPHTSRTYAARDLRAESNAGACSTGLALATCSGSTRPELPSLRSASPRGDHVGRCRILERPFKHDRHGPALVAPYVLSDLARRISRVRPNLKRPLSALRVNATRPDTKR